MIAWYMVVRISGEAFRAGILSTACARFRISIEDQHTGDELKVELVDTASLGRRPRTVRRTVSTRNCRPAAGRARNPHGFCAADEPLRYAAGGQASLAFAFSEGWRGCRVLSRGPTGTWLALCRSCAPVRRVLSRVPTGTRRCVAAVRGWGLGRLAPPSPRSSLRCGTRLVRLPGRGGG